jgi:peptidylprolyl isomerase
MKLTHLILIAMAGAIVASAQTPAKPAAPAVAKAKPAATAAKTPATAATADKLPKGIPAVVGVKKVAFSLRYQEVKIGAGADAVPNKMYKVNYTGWLGNNGRDDDGKKFDSSLDHRSPVNDKDGKPVLDADGKPKLGDPQPFVFPQGFGRVIPGWDQGFGGMKIGGKRRLFIPWQLAYGATGRPPVIPPKSDLIFDVELVDVTEMPMPANHPGMGGMPGGRPMPGGAGATPNGAPGQPGARPFGQNFGKPTPPAAPAAPATPAAPSTPPAPPAPAAPSTPAPAAPTAPAAPAQPQSK